MVNSWSDQEITRMLVKHGYGGVSREGLTDGDEGRTCYGCRQHQAEVLGDIRGKASLPFSLSSQMWTNTLLPSCLPFHDRLSPLKCKHKQPSYFMLLQARKQATATKKATDPQGDTTTQEWEWVWDDWCANMDSFTVLTAMIKYLTETTKGRTGSGSQDESYSPQWWEEAGSIVMEVWNVCPLITWCQLGSRDVGLAPEQALLPPHISCFNTWFLW